MKITHSFNFVTGLTEGKCEKRPYRYSQIFAVPSNKLWKATPWLILVAFILFTQYYFTSIRIPVFTRNTLEIVGAHTSEQHLLPRVLHVLLVAHSRCGSTFTAELLQNLPNSFYYAEPLRVIQPHPLKDGSDEARKLLGDLFVCNVSQVEGFLLWHMIHTEIKIMKKNIRYWKECSKKNTCFNGTYMDSFCRNQTTVIMKTIRLNLLEASRLYTSHPNLNLKIIYLSRDPRGTMNSRMKKSVSKWCKEDPMCSNSTLYCSGLAGDIETVCALSQKRPDDFMVIRYEDLCTDPYGVTEQLVKFLGLTSVPEQMEEFLKTHTHFTGNVSRTPEAAVFGYAYTTFRNSSVTAMRWRTEMPFKDVVALQKVCRRSLSAFGYHSYRTIATLRTNANMNMDLQKSLESTCSTLPNKEKRIRD